MDDARRIMDDTGSYLAWADKCLSDAQLTEDAAQRDGLVRMALMWLYLAQQVEATARAYRNPEPEWSLKASETCT
jgi:hypothetical protein